jgi:PAS domain S-box-containing protein
VSEGVGLPAAVADAVADVDGRDRAERVACRRLVDRGYEAAWVQGPGGRLRASAGHEATVPGDRERSVLQTAPTRRERASTTELAVPLTAGEDHYGTLHVATGTTGSEETTTLARVGDRLATRVASLAADDDPGSATGRSPARSTSGGWTGDEGAGLDGRLLVDGDWRVLGADARARALLDADDPAGSSLWSFPTVAETPLRRALERAAAADEAVTVELAAPHLDTHFEVCARPADAGLAVDLRDVGERVRTRERLEAHRTALRELARTITDGDLDFEQKVERLLAVGRDYLSVADGALAHVDPEEGRHELVRTSPEPVTVSRGLETPLAETYCREAIDGDGLLGVYDAGATGWTTDPAYRASGIGCYLGGEVVVDGDSYGTVCFVDTEGRDRPFSGSERTFVELVVGWIETELERRERERELERYEAIVETVDDGVYALDEQNRYVFVNQGLVSMTGYEREEILGEHASMLTSSATTERADRLQSLVEREEATTAVLETRVETKRGTTVDVENRFRPFPPDADDPGRIGVARDITERKRLEDRLRSIQEVTRELTRATNEFEVCERVVTAAEEVLDRTFVTAIRVDDEQFRASPVASNDAARDVFEPVDTAKLTPEALRETLVWRAYDTGEPVCVDDLQESGSPMADDLPVGAAAVVPVGEFGVLVAADTDPGSILSRELDLVRILGANAAAAIERASRERELRETREALERSNEDLEQFAYAASHDLREPLRMVSSYIQLLDRQYADELDADAREYVDFAVEGAERMQGMIEGLLEYSRVDTRGEDLERTDMDEVVDSALSNLQVRVEETDADVEVGSLPPAVGDARQLVDLVQNLVANAVEHGGPDPTVVVDGHREGADCRYEVRDDGPGMEPGTASRAFEIFERLGADTEGTGIGLALAERIVERHDGSIGIDTAPGEGTTVWFRLPAA